MENSLIHQETKNPSPNSHSTNNSSISSNGLHHPQSPPPPPLTPTSHIPGSRSEHNNPFPTTFVQADTNSFKQVVQMLTGSSENSRNSVRPDPVKNPIPLMKTGTKKTSKLYERRNSLKNFKISPLIPGLVNNPGLGSGSPRMPVTPDVLSPSILDFPSLAISPVTPLIPDPFNRNRVDLDLEAEKKAIERKGFYLHPSPSNTPRDMEPRLLPLFPVTSPKVSVIYRCDVKRQNIKEQTRRNNRRLYQRNPPSLRPSPLSVLELHQDYRGVSFQRTTNGQHKQLGRMETVK